MLYNWSSLHTSNDEAYHYSTHSYQAFNVEYSNCFGPIAKSIIFLMKKEVSMVKLMSELITMILHYSLLLLTDSVLIQSTRGNQGDLRT